MTNKQYTINLLYDFKKPIGFAYTDNTKCVIAFLNKKKYVVDVSNLDINNKIIKTITITNEQFEYLKLKYNIK
jgi:hypothetical protein